MAATRGTLIVVAIVATVCATACNPSPASRDEIQRQIVDAGAVVLNGPDRRRTRDGESVSWDLHVSARWPAYRLAVAKAFAGQFDVVRDDDEALVLTRVATGDRYRLEFRATGASDRVRAVFTASAY